MADPPSVARTPEPRRTEPTRVSGRCESRARRPERRRGRSRRAARPAARSLRLPRPRTAAARHAQPPRLGELPVRRARRPARARSATSEAAARCGASPASPSLRSSIARAPCAASHCPADVGAPGRANASRAAWPGCSPAARPPAPRGPRPARQSPTGRPRTSPRARHRTRGAPDHRDREGPGGPEERSPPTTAAPGRPAASPMPADHADELFRARGSRKGDRGQHRRGLRASAARSDSAAAAARHPASRGRSQSSRKCTSSTLTSVEIARVSGHQAAGRSRRPAREPPGPAPRRSLECGRTRVRTERSSALGALHGSRTDGVESEAHQPALGADPEVIPIHGQIGGEARQVAFPQRQERGVPRRVNSYAAVAGDPEARHRRREAANPPRRAGQVGTERTSACSADRATPSGRGSGRPACRPRREAEDGDPERGGRERGRADQVARRGRRDEGIRRGPDPDRVADGKHRVRRVAEPGRHPLHVKRVVDGRDAARRATVTRS